MQHSLKMKCSHLFFLLSILLLTSCGSTVARRIEKHPEFYNKLSESQKALVQRGQIEEGMGKDAVWLSWGEPFRVSNGAKVGKSYELWSYAGYEPVYNTSIGFAYSHGWGGRCDPALYYAEPSINYVPYEARRVEFLNDRVSAWTTTR